MNLVGQISYVTRWGISIVFVGLVTGVMVVIFPPLAIAGIIALAGVFLLWVLPELRFVPEKLLRTLFFAMVAVQLCVPNYYAIETGYLPWISVRRLFAFAVIFLFSLTIAGSKSARGKVAETLACNRLLAISAFGFLLMAFLSIFTSANWPASTEMFSNILLSWYLPLFVGILVVRTQEDIIVLLKIIAVAAIVNTVAGGVEFVFQHKYYFDLLPKSMIDSMISRNPTLAKMYFTTSFRNGLYRASSIYSVSLSFAEFAAIVAPIAAYFVFHGRNWRERALGIATGICSIVAVFCSGARGGYVAILVAMPVMFFVWTIRYSKLNSQSLLGVIGGVVYALGTLCVMVLVVFWPRLHDMVIGSDFEGASSTDDRFVQWQMALPHILSNPVTGHGLGNSGTLVGYHIESGLPSIDSYIITLLVEVGVPGFLLFFAMITIAIWIGLRLYLTDTDERAAVGGSLGCCLIAFAVYRMALSQSENHTLVFVILGLVFATSKLAYDRLAANQPKKSRLMTNGLPEIG